ncbi:hypothetical protein K504DRAFT_416456 [Pleomassaria siparia CBS 279.74]|uniref:Ribosomal protein YmL11, mitochondrial n=1 Tax=Pleomassaria siparia CBS 279.74 TaxID=1314801 RepID=A0A6G1JW62_9PLEO|nr:hypothetical protein K504DRAFT_416456 [Pleomassaria siparia CBS 279.74]
MPPRIPVQPRALRILKTPSHYQSYASLTAATSTATTPAFPPSQPIRSAPPIRRYPPTQPPSHKPPEVRKSQLHRQYQSLLKSSPLILLFQHNNIKAVEWMGIRRELVSALRKVDAEKLKIDPNAKGLFAEDIRLQIIQTGIFASAMRVVEFFDPREGLGNRIEEEVFTHGLSRRAHEAASNRKAKMELDPLLSGPLAVIAFPTVSPQYLKTVLSILSPSPAFPAPRRKANPDYHDPLVQAGLQKLLLLGARVDGKVFDLEGTRWVGGIDGGIDGLRAQLVHTLEGAGASLANALESASKSLYFTLEGRRLDMEEKEKGPETAAATEEKTE